MPPAVTHADARPYVSLDERQHSAAKRRESVFNGVCHGLINGIIMVPVLVSFAAIIFKNQAFLPELPRLCKLVLISGTVHQMAFVIASSLPFAVGSVQDAGLIFLSSMATAVVNHCDSEGLTRETMLSTTCVVLSLSTAMLGVCLIGVGKLQVAQLVQYLPMPVVGGYLAYIGLFCGQAGLSFMAGISVDGVRDWHRFLDARAAALAAPGAAAGLAMYLAIARVRSVATLPACMSAILAVFFVALAATGSTLSDARAAGWVPAATPHLPLSSAWALFKLTDGGIAWGVLPDVIPSFLAMFFVVAFSSCLDVAAIEMELGKPLDYNRELQTVGLGNLLSGVTGGFTGSYIFSQTIFNLRAGVDTRWAGVTAVLVQLVVAIVPQSIVSFLPKAFFGSLLVVIAVDLMSEWLWRARHRMMPVEFCVCVFTFAAAVATSVVKGLALGTCAAAVAFAFSYAWSTLPVAITARAMDSTVMRTFEERRVLRAHRSQVLVLSLRGYCFFGTAIRLLEKVKSHLERANAAAAADGAGYHAQRHHHHVTHHNHHLFFDGAAPPMSITMNGGTITPPASASSPLGSPHRASIANGFSVVFNRGGPLSLSPQNSTALRRAAAGAAAAAAAAHRRRRGSSGGSSAGSSAGSSYGDLSAAASPVTADGSGGGMWADHDVVRARGGSSGAAPLLTGAAALLSSSTAAGAASPGSVHTVYGTARTPRDDAAAPLPTLRRSSSARSAAAGGGGGSGGARYVVLDMREVPGVDATAARVCFLMLKQLLHASGVTPVFAAVRKPVRNLLTAHKVIDSGDAVFDTLDAALEWCEERLLQAAVRRVFDASGQAAAPPPQPPRSAPLPLPPPLQPPPPPDAAAAAAAAALSLSPEESLMLRDVEYYSHAVAMRASNASERGSLGAVSSSSSGGGGGGIGGRLAQHEADAAAAVAAVAPVMGGEVPGSLCAILEDYLEVDQPQERARNRELLQRCMQYFREEVIPKDTELFNEADGSTKLRFIKAGAVELQMVTLNSDDTAAAGAAARGELHRHRLMKVSAGGTFGEVGFFLRRAQPFRAIALERCIVFTLSRPAMDRMQRESPELCVLVQKAVLKSLCLEASFSIEAQHFAPF